MYIAEIEVTDLRSFAGTQRISLERDDGSYAGWTVFAGRNGSGKSTLLKATAAAVVGLRTAASLGADSPVWIRHGADAARANVMVVLDRERDRFAYGPETSHELWSTGLEWSHARDGFHAGHFAPDGLKAWHGPWADRPTGWFIVGYGPYRRLGALASESGDARVSPQVSRLLNLFNESATLSEAVDWLKAIQFRALEKRPGAKELVESVLQLINDGLLPDGSRAERVASDGLWIERDGTCLPLEQMSDGYRTVTAMVVDIARRLHEAYGSLEMQTREDGTPYCPLPGVVLIDEVDAHLHVEWQQKIGFWLTEHFPAIQFLVTTHSPFICQAASSKGIIRLPAPGEERTIEHIDERLFNAIVNGGADDAVMTQLFGLEHAHSPQAEKLRERLAELELKILLEQASPEEEEEYETLRARMPDSLGEEADRKLRAVRLHAEKREN